MMNSNPGEEGTSKTGGQEEASDEYDTETEKRKRKESSNGPNKKKRLQKYRSEWESQFFWLEKSKNNNFEARCKLCDTSFSIANGGVAQVKQHDKKDKHLLKTNVFKKNAVMDQFVKEQKSSTLLDKICAAELSKTYHTVKHNLSYASQDCSNKLDRQLYSDSKILSEVQLGRTKMEAIVNQVLGPKALEDVLKDLNDPNIYFCIQSDASNRKNVKLFPLAVQYFTLEKGIQNKLLDFYENSDESADGMFNAISKTLNDNKLSFKKVTGLSADNTNANFGKNHSLFTNLQNEIPDLLRGNCHAHIVHNCVRKAMSFLDYDIENLILKIYGHFSVSAVRTKNLKEFVNFVQSEWHDLKRHISTRWLSLLPAIDNIYLQWKAIKSYFLSLDECPKDIKRVMLLNENSEVESDFDEIEIYLAFCSHILNVFNITIKEIEGNKVTILEVFEIFSKLKSKLEKRKTDKFFGFETRNKLNRIKTLGYTDKFKSITDNFVEFLNEALGYLKKWFDFEETNFLSLLSKINLQKSLVFDEVEPIILKLNLNDKLSLCMDQIYNEIDDINEIYIEISKIDEFKNLSLSAERWFYIFSRMNGKYQFQNMFKLISFFLSVPASSAYVERIFSVMNIKWDDERNRCGIDLVKNELLIYFNFEISCLESRNYFLQDKALLKKAKSSEKYSFKN